MQCDIRRSDFNKAVLLTPIVARPVRCFACKDDLLEFDYGLID